MPPLPPPEVGLVGVREPLVAVRGSPLAVPVVLGGDDFVIAPVPVGSGGFGRGRVERTPSDLSLT